MMEMTVKPILGKISEDLETSNGKVIFVSNAHRYNHTLHRVQEFDNSGVHIFLYPGSLKINSRLSRMNDETNCHTYFLILKDPKTEINNGS
jgi:hypothetical protein